MTRTTIATFIAALAVAVTPAGAQAAARTAAASPNAPAARTAPKPKPRTAYIEASGAGVAGWDDSKCGMVAEMWSMEVDAQSRAIARGDNKSADFYGSEAAGLMDALEGNCVVTGIG